MGEFVKFCIGAWFLSITLPDLYFILTAPKWQVGLGLLATQWKFGYTPETTVILVVGMAIVGASLVVSAWNGAGKRTKT